MKTREGKVNIKTNIKNIIVKLFLAMIGVTSVYAVGGETQEVEFSTIEDEGSILDSGDGQEEVRERRLAEDRAIRLAEEKAERERLAKEEEARLAELARVEEENRIAEENRIVEEKQLAEAKEVKTASSESKPNNTTSQSGTSLGTFEATAYGPDCVGCSGVTANGTDIRNGNIYSNGYRVIAADTRVIPMNSIVKITYSSGKTEMAIVADVGGKIKGRIIDIAFASEAETPAFGRQQVQIELIK